MKEKRKKNLYFKIRREVVVFTSNSNKLLNMRISFKTRNIKDEKL